MRAKLLLLFLMFGGFLSVTAQDTIKSVIFSEVRMDEKWNSYVELTNMGTETVDLSQFSVTAVSSWQHGYISDANREAHLPAVNLAPGESYVIASVFDFMEELSKLYPNDYSPYNKPELREIADLVVECNEAEVSGLGDDPRDSTSVYYDALYSFSGAGSYFLEWHAADGSDSAVVDLVNLIFDGDQPTGIAYDVAGVTKAPETHILVRKHTVTQGNLDWNNSRGTDLIDSEWLPVPVLQPGTNQEYDRDLTWTVGNHGDYNLDASTLEVDRPGVSIDFNAKLISVPWGMRNNDTIMHYFKKKPGISWFYEYAPSREDSAYTSIREGDQLVIYVCGDDLDVDTFDFAVRNPLPGDNFIIPKNRLNFSDNTYPAWRGYPFDATDGVPGMDTIYNVDNSTRIDSLLKYFEKAPNASWKVITQNDEQRAELRDGDILEVTAENGDVREYYIKVDPYYGNHNSFLASITWPDIPEFYKGLFGWKGDTIPNFSAGNLNYTINVPFDVDGIPALVAKPQSNNTKVEIERAKALVGSPEDRTITITTTASDDSTQSVYKILLIKEKDPANIQPWLAEPFISQWSHREQGSDGAWNSAWELVNPGTEQIDMSNYMFIKGSGTPADVVGMYTDWDSRHRRYIPGYQWVDSAKWVVDPATFEPDLRVNTITYGGDVFVMASAGWTTPLEEFDSLHWNEANFDVNFKSIHNPWHISRTEMNNDVIDDWGNNTWWLFRIDNDSIKMGKKAATDPNDFTLIDVFGTADPDNKWDYLNCCGAQGNDHKRTHFRKSWVYHGNPVPGAMFSTTNADSSEWYSYKSPNDWYNVGVEGWTNATRATMSRLGTHDMDEVTVYRSTISSLVYIASQGYSENEQIRGVTTGTTVEEFLNNIIKADTGQDLTVKTATGTVLNSTDQVSDGDVLEVVSADEANLSKYVLEVTAEGLSDDALLTSSEYTIDVSGDAGTISGMEYSTLLKDVLANVTVPAGATLTVVDGNNEYQPMKQLNNDTVYIDVTATSNAYFEVVSESGDVTVLYQLLPTTADDQAMLTSFVYEVDQTLSNIKYVPAGILYDQFVDNLIPATGASLKIVDKLGFEKTSGPIYMDDIVVVTAKDGETKKYYHIENIRQDILLSPQAFVVSDVYSVDQVARTIDGEEITNELSPASLMANLTPAVGATIRVVDADNNENTSGALQVGDKVEVTSANGEHVVYYDLNVKTVGINGFGSASVRIYPNPTSDNAVITGIASGNRIHVYNSLGVQVRDIVSASDRQVLSLESEPAGIYLIVIENKGELVGRYSLMKVMK